MGRQRGAQNLVLRPRRHRSQRAHGLDQGCAIPQRDQGLVRRRLPVGDQRRSSGHFFWIFLKFFEFFEIHTKFPAQNHAKTIFLEVQEPGFLFFIDNGVRQCV